MISTHSQRHILQIREVKATELARFEQAIEEGARAIELDPTHSFAYSNLASACVFRGRLDDAEATQQRASSRKLDTPETLILHDQIVFLKNDSAEMHRLSALGHARADTSDWMYDQEALVLPMTSSNVCRTIRP